MHKTLSYKIFIRNNNAYSKHDYEGDDFTIGFDVHLLADLVPIQGRVDAVTTLRVLHFPEKELVLADLHHNNYTVEKEGHSGNHGAVVPAALSEHFYYL